MALHLVTILADSLDRLASLRGRDLDLHERVARRAENGVYEVPAALTDDQIARLLAQGYRVVVHHSADEVARQRLAEVDPQVDRLQDRDRSAQGRSTSSRTSPTWEPTTRPRPRPRPRPTARNAACSAGT